MSTLTYEQMMALYDREREAREADRETLAAQITADREALAAQITTAREALAAKIKADHETQEARDKELDCYIKNQREALAAMNKGDLERAAAIGKLEASLAKTELLVKNVCQQLAHIGFSNGDAAEDFFFSSLEEKKALGDIHFDEIDRNLHRKKDRVEDEYDIFLKNGNTVAIVEVKYKVTTEHINQLTTRKVQNFRKLFPKYARYTIYTGIAGMSFAPKSEALAKAEGVAVLKQKGDHMVVNAKSLKAF